MAIPEHLLNQTFQGYLSIDDVGGGLDRSPEPEKHSNYETPFSWWNDLSPDAQKLYECLIEERGDTDLLPLYATEDQFDLNAALDELRTHGCLDESDPSRIKLRNRQA